MNSVYQAFIIHPHKIRRPGNKANMMQAPFNTKPKEVHVYMYHVI